MRAWARHALGAGRRQNMVRAAFALVLLAVLIWVLPVRRPGEEGGHHGGPGPALDVFEKAGVTELTDGQRGPAFRLRTFPGDGRASLQEFQDNLIVLNFWATWCTPCTVEMPTLERLWHAYRGRGLVVIGVSVDRGAPPALLEPYVRHHKLSFPILLDPDMATAGAWRVTGLPATFLIRPGGDVAGMAMGAREWDSAEMRALVEALLPKSR